MTAATSGYAGPQQPLDDTQYWAPDWTGSIATVTDGLGLKYPVAAADVTYQGAEATPTIRPKVGQRFYVRIRTHKTNYQLSAGYRMRVLLPTGVEADITSPQDVVCTLTDSGGNIRPMLPGECQDPVKMGLYWEFATATLHSGETGWYWFPVKATQPQSGSSIIQLLSQQMTQLIGAVPDPMVGSVPLRVDPAAATAPSPPLSPWAVSGNAKATISWSAPSSTGGSAITSYTATARASGTTVGHSCYSTTALSCTIEGLTNGVPYSVTVVASNVVGTSAPSVVVTATPQSSATGTATVPGAPASPRSDSGFGIETVSWSAPASDGGSPIIGYTARAYTASSGGAPVGTCTTTTLSCTILGTSSPDTLYYVEIVARNGVGTGSPSTRVAATRAVVAGAPPCPVNATAVISGHRQATASWTRPLVSPGGCGGVTEIQYQVRATDALGMYRGGCITTSSYPALPPTTCTVTGLANGVAYTIDVIAYNFLGWGRPSNALGVTPLGPPDAPPSVLARPGDGSAEVSWGAVVDGGRPLTGVTARAYSASNGGSPAASCTAQANDCTIMGLANGTTYYVDVVATNAIGAGPPSTPRVAVTPGSASPAGLQASGAVAAATGTAPVTRAPAPQAVRAVGMRRGGVVTWRAVPARWRVTSYVIRAWSRPSGGVLVSRCVTPASRPRCRLRGIASGRRVYVDVSSRTSGGAGLPSKPRRMLVAR